MRISDWSSDVCSSDLLRNRLALGQRLFVALVADLFELAQLVVDALESSARGAERAFGDDALFEHRLALLFQRHGRVFVAGSELGRQFAQAAVALTALAAHAFERLRKRRDIGAVGIAGTPHSVRGSG